MKNIFFVFVVLMLSLPIYALSAVARQDKVYGTNPTNDPRRGTVYHWTDPQTGDRITSVQPGKKQPSPTPQMQTPVYVYPEISPPHKPWPKPRD